MPKTTVLSPTSLPGAAHIRRSPDGESLGLDKIARRAGAALALLFVLGWPLGACGGPKPIAAPRPLALPHTVHLGAPSGLAPGLAVARNAQEWETLWDLLVSGLLPAPAAPVRDFGAEMVICVSLGERPSAGYDVSIDKVVRELDRLVVHAREHKPRAGVMQAAVLTYPTALAALDASALPVELVWD
jgi:hypothetical protein